MTIMHWLLWKLSRNAFNINTAFLPFALSWWEKYLLSPGMPVAVIPVTRCALCKYVRGAPFLTVRQSHQPPWEGLHSLHWLCAPSNCVSQSSSVFVLTCHDGFAWDFTYIGQVAAQALQFVSSPLVSKGSSSQRSWKVVYRSVGFVCLLFKVVSTQSLSCGKTTEFGDSLFLLRV